METNNLNLIKIKCIKEYGKLRIRIISNGYNNFANCQCPRNIRLEGREYLVPSSDITFNQTMGCKFFYRIKKNNIHIIPIDDTRLIIYEDKNDINCCICMDGEKDTAFYPCGHYHCCNICAIVLLGNSMKCPICRSSIERLVNKDQFQ